MDIATRNWHDYMSQQTEEEPWFRCVKTMETYSEPLLVTPEMARQLLNTKAKRSLRVVGPSDLVLSGTHHNVSMNFSGHLVEGEQILEKLIETNKPLRVLFTFNLSDQIAF